ncbi:MAG: RNA recognition motif domain-containing protein [Elusimicrobiota bacterium]
MGKKMFVGGLPYEVTETQLKTIFAACGTVVSAKVIMDRETGRSKGFGFVEMATDAEAAAAIAKLNNSPVGERRMFVNEARPMEPRAPGAPSSRPGGSGPRPSFDKPAFGGFSDKPSFGPDKKGFHERKKKYEDRKGGFDGGGKGGFGGKKGGGGKKGKGHDDDDAGW